MPTPNLGLLHGGRRKRAVVYGRVSKPDRSGKREATSVDQQIDRGRRRADSQDWEVVGVYRDDGISASRFANGKARAEWQRVVEQVIAGGCDILILWEVSRATRDRTVYANLIGACVAAGVLIDVGGRLHDPSDPDEGFLLDLQAGLAVRESGVTSKRIRANVEARAQAGTPHGKLPYGYRRIYEQRPAGRVLLEQVPDPETAPVVAELARRLLAGESAYSIAADFDKREIPSPETTRAIRTHGPDAPRTSWRLETIRDLALSPTLAGQRIHQGRIVGEATWQPIISAADHLALTALLRDGRPRQFRPGTVQHLLSGIAVCGLCGAPLRHMLNRGLPSYWCPGPDRRGNGCVSRSKVKLDALVTLHVVKRLSDPGLLTDLAASQDGAQRQVGEAAVRLRDLRAQLSAFVSAAAEGKVSAESFAAIEPGLQRKIAEAAGRVPQAGTLPPVVLAIAGPDAEQSWDDLGLDDRRLVVRSLVSVTVHRTSLPRGSRTFDPSTIEIVDRWRS